MADKSALRMADKSTVNESVRQEEGPILQLNRPLLSIDEYAAREGVSRGIVEECGKLGIIQIRRYKGQTFVVDVPLSPYSSTSELAKEFIRPADKAPQVQRISEPAQKVIPNAPRAEQAAAPKADLSADRPADSAAIKAGLISQTVKRMFSKAAEMSGRVIENIDNEIEQLRHTVSTAASKTSESAAGNQAQQTSSPSSQNATADAVKITAFEPARPAVIPPAVAKAVVVEKPAPRQAPSPVVERLSAPAAQPAQITEIPRAVSHPQGNVLQAVISAAQTKLSNFWQIGMIFVSAFLFVAVFVGLWLYMDRKIQLYRLDQAYTSIQKMYTDLVQSKQKTETLETELNTSRTEFERVQTNLNRSQSEIETARNELAQARRNLETIQGRNAEAVEKLNSQIQEFTNRLNELTKNP
jgi:archaellum component FlaC